MSVQAIESLGGHQKGLPLMNIDYSSVLNVVLLAYTVDGFITWKILQGSFTMELFEKFIEFKVLPRCNPYPAEHSVIIMDNTPIYISDVCTNVAKITDN